MKIGKTISWLCLGAMTAGLLNGFINGDFFVDGGKLLSNPWGVMSLIDLYVGFTIFSMWIFFREISTVKAIIWTVLMMILGFFTASLYLIIVFHKSKGDWVEFFFGGRKDLVQ
jgi:hypothetical protein